MSALRQPDPSRGIFETMLVHAGLPVELDAHLGRLGASLRELYGLPLPSSAETSARDAAAEPALGRLRLTVAPNAEGGLAVEAAARAVESEAVFPAWEHGAALRSIPAGNGLGPHKWVDRALLHEAEEAEPGTVPLLVDGDGVALEAGRANLFAARGGVLVTPPADGRILPGIARARTIELAREAGIEVREGLLSLDDLRDADEVFLTGSVRGIEPARSLDGAPLPRSGEVTGRLAGALRRLWLSAPS